MNEMKAREDTPEAKLDSIEAPGKQPWTVQLKQSVKGLSFEEGRAALSPSRFGVQMKATAPVQKQAEEEEEEEEAQADGGKDQDEEQEEQRRKKKPAASRSREASDDKGNGSPVQPKVAGAGRESEGVKEAAAQGTAGSAQTMPHLDAIQRSFGGHDVSNVQTYVGGRAAEASKAMGAEAYTTGNRVAFKASPDLHTAAHEAAHVVQQRGGVSLKDGVGRLGDTYEQHADAVADLVVQGKSAQGLLDQARAAGQPAARSHGASVQLKPKAVKYKDAGHTMIAIMDALRMAPTGTTYPAKYKSLVAEWFLLKARAGEGPDAAQAKYRGSGYGITLKRAIAATRPLIRAVKKQGNPAQTKKFLAEYFSTVDKLKKVAIEREVHGAIAAGAKKGIGGNLDFSGLYGKQKVQVAALAALGAARSVSTLYRRAVSANAADVKKIDALFANKEKFPHAVPPGLASAKVLKLQATLHHIHGCLNLINAIATASSKDEVIKLYQIHSKKFGKAAGYTEVIKNLGQYVAGATALLGTGTWAIATVLGKTNLATKALLAGGTVLGKINLALNVAGVIHGIAVLANDKATAEEKAEAMVEVGSSGLGIVGTVVGKWVPMVGGVCSAVSGSLIINFYLMRGLLTAGLGAYEGMIKLGLNVCYKDMHQNAIYTSSNVMKLAVAKDLAAQEKDPAKQAVYAKQIKFIRAAIIDRLKAYVARATGPGGANRDPGTWAILRRRFMPLIGMKKDTDAQVLNAAKLFLQVVLKCEKDAPAILKAQAAYTYKNRKY